MDGMDRGLDTMIKSRAGHPCGRRPGGFLPRPAQLAADAIGRAKSRPRERHFVLDFGLRRPPGRASSSRSSGFAARFSLARGAAACLLAAAFALLLGAGAAEAQTPAKLVSNAGQTAGATDLSLTVDRAQRFTTGSNAGGYTLTRVDLVMALTSGTLDYTVEIRRDAGNAGPGAIVSRLVNPANLPTSLGNAQFAVPGLGIHLAPNAKYWVVFEYHGGSPAGGWSSTTSTAEDTGAAAGWIAGDVRAHFAGGSWSSVNGPLRIAVHGFANQLTTLPSPLRGAGLVSNGGQSSFSVADFRHDIAQAFTTGIHVHGYKLTGAGLVVQGSAAIAYNVTIRSDSSGVPGGSLGTLTRPADHSENTDRFPAKGDRIDLDPNKTYWVVIDSVTADNRGTIWGSNSDAEDAGAAPGWSIGDVAKRRDAASTSSTAWADHPGGVALKIGLEGYAKSSDHGRAEPPASPAAPTLSETDGTTLTVSWSAPANTAPAVTDYDLRYRRKGDTAWTEHDHSGAARTAIISNVLQGASWEAQVRATNSVGTSAWSEVGAGHTGPARFVSGRVHPSGRGMFLHFTKNIQSGHPGHESRYLVRIAGSLVTIHSGEVLFDLIDGGVAIRVANRPVQFGEAVTVAYTTVGSVHKLRDADGLDIASFGPETLTNRVPRTAPAAPTPPTVAAVANTRNLSVSWTAPADGGSAITDYDLRYYAGSADPMDGTDWVEENEASGLDVADGTAVTRTISGLKASTAYRVQVRAENAEGEGAWSASGTATTNAATSTTNNAPIRMMLGASPSDGCVRKTADTPFEVFQAPSAQTLDSGPLVGTADCGNVPSRKAPMFSDPDGDTLTFTAQVRNLPDNVVLADFAPLAHTTQDRVHFEAVAVREQTDVRVEVTATDPHGASVSTFFTAQVAPPPDTQGAPSLAAAEGLRFAFAGNEDIGTVVLPAATGGDVRLVDPTQSYEFPYFYAVTGLPPGLSFDASTRSVSGTPTETGTWTVTYTADDADDAWAGKDSPTAADTADTASATFTIHIGKRPEIYLIRIVSSPTYDSNGDGVNDTYVRGDKIFIDVEFRGNEPVAIGGAEEVRLRLDLGADDSDLTNSRKELTLSLDNVIFADEVLRFVHTVEAGDSDGDGVWVQPESASSNQVLFLEDTTTLTHADTGVAADLTFGKLRMTGDPRAKVDGSKTAADTGPRPTVATVDGDTLTLTYNRDLQALGESGLDALRRDFLIQGAGGIENGVRGAAQHAKSIAMTARTVTLTLSGPARAGDTVVMSYTGRRLWDTSTPAKRAPRFRDLAVTNAMAGAAGPAPLGGAVVQTGTSPARSKMALYFSEALDAGSQPAAGDFAVRVGESAVTVSGVEMAGNAVLLTLDRLAAAGTRFEVSYTPGANPIRDLARNAAAPFRETLRAVASGAPALQSAVADGNRIELTYNKALDPASVPAAGAFELHEPLADGLRVSRSVQARAVTVEGRTAVLRLDHPVFPCEGGAPLTVSYRKPAASPLQGLDGTAASHAGQSGITYLAVTNARAGWCNVGWFDSSRVGSVIVRAKRPYATDIEPQPGWFTVTASGGPVTVTGAAYSADDPYELKLTLDREFAPDETVTVSYIRPEGESGLWDVTGQQLADIVDRPVANTAVPAENRPATGAPAIAGTARVGETLMASTDGIADEDGLTGAAYSFQWVSGDGTADTDIAGATALSYTLTAAEEGRTLRVRVSFTDDAGNVESLMSAATDAVAPLLPPLTATFVDVPAEHDGKRLFRFELRFSEDFPGRLGYKILRDHAFVVTNGKVREAKRFVQGSNERWAIAVRPASHEAVTIVLPAGSVAIEDGRTLANTARATVAGPATLSVADAEATEGADEAVEFRVTLSRAASGTVTVDYATRDGTAVAGEDYTRTRGTLSFAAGELEKTVAVPILDDALDEGSETFKLKLMNARGAAIADGEAVGTIENSDPLQKMWLSRFGRTVAGQVTEAVSDRLANPLTGAQVTVGGQSVDLAQTGDGAVLTQALTAVAAVLGAPGGPTSAGDSGLGSPGSGPGQAGAGGWPGAGLGVGEAPATGSEAARTPSGRELLLGSALHLAREGDGTAPDVAAWGRVTAGGFDGKAPAETGSVRIDGTVTTGILGADVEWNRLLFGVAISVSEGEGTFDQPGVDSGKIESTMTTVSPFARYMLHERVSVWGLAGWGTGDMTITQAANENQPERISRTDLGMRLAALGGRGALTEAGESGGIDLALKADGFWVETESDPVSNEGRTAASASRVRLALDGSRAFRMNGGGVLAPSLELGLRHDGGDADTGMGLELGGSLAWTDPQTGLSVDARVRALIAHEDSNYREWGASGSVRLAPGERGRGLSFSLSPTWGAPSSGVERMWSARDARGLAPGGGFEAAQGLQGELGYGLGLFGDRFTGTPNLGFGLSDSAREYRVGWRLTSAVRGDIGFRVDLNATRREAANGNAPPEHGVMLSGAVQW